MSWVGESDGLTNRSCRPIKFKTAPKNQKYATVSFSFSFQLNWVELKWMVWIDDRLIGTLQSLICRLSELFEGRQQDWLSSYFGFSIEKQVCFMENMNEWIIRWHNAMMPHECRHKLLSILDIVLASSFLHTCFA